MDAVPASAAERAAAGPRRGVHGPPLWPGRDAVWPIAFALPYVVVFLAFVVYPVAYGLWLGRDPASYRALFDDPIYAKTVVNTLLFWRSA